MKSLFALSVIFGALTFNSLAHANTFDPNESIMGIDVNAVDNSVKPCDDFYQYACGNWIKKTEIPSDKSNVVRSFTEIYDRNLEILHKALETGANSTPKDAGSIDPETQKLNDFYASCMNESEIEKTSPKALKTELETIDHLKSKDDLAAVLAEMKLKGVTAFFSFWDDTDLVDPDHKIGSLAQGGMGLPDSTYYTSTDPKKTDIRIAYVEYIKKMLVLTGTKASAAKKEAPHIYAIEESLAKSALTPQLRQDPTLNYHPSVVADLKTAAPIINWDVYFKDLGISTPKKFDLTEPKFLAAVQAVAITENLDNLKNYLRFRMIDSFATDLDKKIYNEWFQFHGIKLSGQKVPEPRWKRCVQTVGSRHGGMGEALGKAYVKAVFSPKAKAQALEMITNIRKALQKDLNDLDWLDSATRKKALEKLDKITLKIGYPDKWKDYSSLKISRDNYLENNIHASEFTVREALNRIGGPVDPTLWEMTPQTVNAYYAPDLNQINFPAGILQPPFFSENFSDPANYGAIGMVIGHEITHGFDTVGSKFDGRGMMSDWWTAKVKKQFEDKASCMKKQYSGYEALPGLPINGDLTITENIADNGGLKIAHAAYMMSTHGKDKAPNLGSYNDDQQFFMSAAQGWCRKATDEALHRQVSSDPHSPAKYRINGSFSNNLDFAKAFSCSDGTPMAPKNRCLIW